MTACYDIDGNVYPCQGFAPVSIGEQAENFKIMMHLNLIL